MESFLTEEEINYYKAIQERIVVKIGKETVRPTKGLPEGSTLSPLLFNVFIQKIMDEASKGVNGTFQGFADDWVANIEDGRQITSFLNALKET